MEDEGAAAKVVHEILVRADSGAFYATCKCGEWKTESLYFSRREAREVGRDHLCEVR